MNGKRLHQSSQASPEKSGKRRHFDHTPEVATPSKLDDVYSIYGYKPNAHAEASPGNVLDEDLEPQPSSHSATSSDQFEQDSECHDQSHYNSETPSETNNAQDLASVENQSVHDEEDALTNRTSTLVKTKAVDKSLTDWPAKSQGFTEEICDLRKLKQFMTSDEINDDHKAMWVSLVQTIVHAPDRDFVLNSLQDMLSGDLVLPANLNDHVETSRLEEVTRSTWTVTGSMEKYGKKLETWSAASFVYLAFWNGGPEAGNQAARALRVFGIWNPTGSFEPAFSIHSIETCLTREDILRRIWPSHYADRVQLLAWANRDTSSTEMPFQTFEDAHSHLLRECIGEDLRSFPHMTKKAFNARTGGFSIVTRPYFDRILAPILSKHFDEEIDLELAYTAVNTSQSKLVQKIPPQVKNDKGDRGKGGTTQPIQYPDDAEDDSEGEYERRIPIKKERRIIKQETTSDFAEYTGYYGNNLRSDKTYQRNASFKKKAGKCTTQPDVSPRDHPSDEEAEEDATSVQIGEFKNLSKPKGTRHPLWTREEDQLGNNLVVLTSRNTSLSRDEVCVEVSRRLKDEHNIIRTPKAVSFRWSRVWPSVAQAQKQPRRTDDQSENVTNVAQARFQRPVMLTRQSRATMDQRSVNYLYLNSRTIPSNVIAQFIAMGKSSFESSWHEVLEHRTKNGMTDSGSNEHPPYPSDGLANDVLTNANPDHARRRIEVEALKQLAEDIKKGVRRPQSSAD